MSRTSIARPEERADANERTVFHWLTHLVGDWDIIWGYQYTDADRETREGDFLILGPQGGLMVLEVKGCHELLVDAADGRWSGRGDNPFVQLSAQWDAVIEAINRTGNRTSALTVVRALGVPNISREIARTMPHLAESDSLILDRKDLADFAKTWDRVFNRYRDRGFYPNPESRECFLDTPWGLRFTQKPEKVIGDFLDLEIDRLSRAQFSVLDHLSEYSRFAISGAAGTGKTWLLLELALRWAGRDGSSGRDVLLLCYNTALESFLNALVNRLAGKSKQGADRIHVRSWEAIAKDCCLAIGEPYAPPADRHERQRYFSEQIPAALELALRENRIQPAYDALAVDEAQDHDTDAGALPDGWWSIYRALLRQPDTAPIAVAYDTAQRPRFAHPERFDPAVLLRWLGPATARLRCPSTLRYTPVLVRFLASLAERVGVPFAPPPVLEDSPTEGRPVLELLIPEPGVVATVERIALQWIEEGAAIPSDILIITAGQDWQAKLGDRLGNRELVAVEVRSNGKITQVSAGRGKGLEARAVIVVGFYPFNLLPEGYQHSFFLAASRARQLLAIINVEPPPAQPQAPADAPIPAPTPDAPPAH